MIVYTFTEREVYARNARNAPYYEPDVEINVGIRLWTSILPTEHTHGFWEIIFLYDGSFINILEGERRQINKYDVCLVKKTNIHSLRPDGNVRPAFYNIAIREEYFEKLANCISPDFFDNIENNQYKTLHPQVFNEIKKLLDEAFNAPITNQRKKQSLFQIAVAKLLTEFAVKPERTEKSLVNQVISLMSSPNNMQLTVKEIADQLAFSVEHITRLFKKEALGSPNQIFTQIKLHYACELLSTTDYKTLTISEMVGFSNVNYFNKLFKKHIGVSPMVYHKKFAFQTPKLPLK